MKCLALIAGLGLTAALVAGCRDDDAERTRRARALLQGADAAASPAPAAEPASQPATQPATQPGPRQASPPASGSHQRMRAQLVAARERLLRADRYVGRDDVDRLRRGLADAPDDLPTPERMRLQFDLGHALLRLGRTDEAIEQLKSAYAGVDALPAKWRGAARQIAWSLAVAWLRKGEDLHCAAQHHPDSCIAPVRGGGVHRDPTAVRNALTWLDVTASLPGASEAERLAVRWLAALAHQLAGDPPAAVPEAHRVPPGTFESAADFPRFVDVAPRLGLARWDLSGGAVVDDFDGDGDLDIVTSSWDPAQRLAYYRNDGGRFVERGVEAGFEGITGGLNLVHADADGDGDLDLLVLRGAWRQDLGRVPNSLLLNDGAGVFDDVALRVGLAGPSLDRPTQTAAFADFDLDGDLDIYVGNEARGPGDAPSQLFRREADGTYVDVAALAGVTNDAYAKGVVWADVDGDGDPDLYVSNMSGPNRLYLNRGDGTFTDVAEARGLVKPFVAFPAVAFDVENDGAVDLLAFSGYRNDAVIPPLWNAAADLMGLPHEGEPMRLYRNDGEGGFTDASAAVGLDRHVLAMGSNVGDLDNDGFLDLYLGTGYPEYEALMPNRLFRNDGGQRFVDVSYASGTAHLQKGHGVSFADLDADGDLDLFVQMGGAYPGDAFGNVLFENPGAPGKAAWIELVDARGGVSPFGARVEARLPGGRRLVRWVGTGGSFGGNPLRVHLGLGGADRVEALTITWPGGEEQILGALPAGQIARVTQGEAGVVLRPLVATPFGGG